MVDPPCSSSSSRSNAHKESQKDPSGHLEEEEKSSYTISTSNMMMKKMKKEEEEDGDGGGELELGEEKTEIQLKLDKQQQQQKMKKKKQKKKGMNPLKARLRGLDGDDSHLIASSTTKSTSTSTSTYGEVGSSDQVQETLDFSTGSCPSSKSESNAEVPPLPFEASQNGPLLTLLFTSASIQHATLARIETFYESPCQPSSSSSSSSSNSSGKRGVGGIAGGVYRSWRKIHEELGGATKLCRGYEAFNLPLSSVQEWLVGMYESEVGPSEESADVRAREEGGNVEGLEAFAHLQLEEEEEQEQEERKRWYRPFCNQEEVRLLEYLSSLDALDLTPPASARARGLQQQQKAEKEHVHPDAEVDLLPPSSSSSSKTQTRPTYLISSLSRTSSTSLPHERLHALYHLSQRYRSRVQLGWSSLSGKAQRVIRHDLGLRGYDQRVFVDEWQAYTLGDFHPLPLPPLPPSLGRTGNVAGGASTSRVQASIQATPIWGPKVKEELSSLVAEMLQVAIEESQIWLPDVKIWR